MSNTMMEKMERAHNARMLRAHNNIKMMFATEEKFGFVRTEKEIQAMEDLRPGMYRIFTK